MTWWNESEVAGGSYEAPSGNDPIPDNSSVLAMIASAQWKSPRDNDTVEYIELEWTIAQPEEYANRKLWTKLWVDDLNPEHKNAEKQRDTHRRLLTAIDQNCGSKLAKKGNPHPSDTELAVALMQRPMVIKVKEWEMNGNKGNWVCGVSPKTSAVSVAPAAAPKPKAMAAAGADIDDDIPF